MTRLGSWWLLVSLGAIAAGIAAGIWIFRAVSG